MRHYDDGHLPAMRPVKDILQVVVPDLFQKSKSERRADSIEAMKREMPKICAMLDMDPETLKPIEKVRA